MAAEDAEIFYKIVKASSKQIVVKGAKQAGLPDSVASGLADQLAFTFDLVKKGSQITPAYLAVLLAGKGLGIAKIAAGNELACGIAVAALGVSITKAVAFTTFTGPAHFAVDAIALLSDCYSMDKACGISDAAKKQIDAVAEPAYMWLERGVIEWMSRGGG